MVVIFFVDISTSRFYHVISTLQVLSRRVFIFLPKVLIYQRGITASPPTDQGPPLHPKNLITIHNLSTPLNINLDFLSQCPYNFIVLSTEFRQTNHFRNVKKQSQVLVSLLHSLSPLGLRLSPLHPPSPDLTSFQDFFLFIFPNVQTNVLTRLFTPSPSTPCIYLFFYFYLFLFPLRDYLPLYIHLSIQKHHSSIIQVLTAVS